MAAKSEIVSAPTTPREAAQPAVTPSRSRIGPHVAGVLSYLVPGLGQIVQGRVAKGVLFFVCIYALFFYGLFLGSGTATLQAAPSTSSDKGHAEEPATVVHRVSGSVFLPDSTENLGSSLYNRPQFLAQFWVGIAAWPAIYQYLVFDKNETYADNRLGGFMRQPGGALKSADSSFGEPAGEYQRRGSQCRLHHQRQDDGAGLGLQCHRRGAQHHGNLRRRRRAGLPGHTTHSLSQAGDLR